MNPSRRDPDCCVLHGELHLTLTAAARCYQVEVHWVEEVFGQGLLGRGEQVDDATCIAAVTLDQLATIIRMHFHQGVDLPGIVALLASSRM
jgi:hypothetical protein